ncbi:hypothetical protein Droror1_Dr00019989 [Drosera rotundifolia]
MTELKHQSATSLITKLGSVDAQTRRAALSELHLLTKTDPSLRPILASLGAIPFLSDTLYSSSHDAQSAAAAALLNISITTPQSLLDTPGLLDTISYTLMDDHTSPTTLQCCAATLTSLMIDEGARPIIGSKRDIVYALVRIVKKHDQYDGRSLRDVLRALFGIVLWEGNRGSVIELGGVEALFRVVKRDGRKGLVEDALAVIGQVAGCRESWEGFGKVDGVRVFVGIMCEAGCGTRVKENAVAGVLNLVRFGGGNVREEVLGMMGEEAVEGVMEMADFGTPRGKSKATALIDVLGLNSVLDHGRHPDSYPDCDCGRDHGHGSGSGSFSGSSSGDHSL